VVTSPSEPRDPEQPRKLPVTYLQSQADPAISSELVEIDGFTEWSYWFEGINNKWGEILGVNPTPDEDDAWYDHLGKSLITIPSALGGLIGMWSEDTKVEPEVVEHIEGSYQRMLNFVWDQLSDSFKFGVYTVATGIGGVIGLPILSWLNGRILEMDPMERPALNAISSGAYIYNPVWTHAEPIREGIFIGLHDPRWNPIISPILQVSSWPDFDPIISAALIPIKEYPIFGGNVNISWVIGGVTYSGDFGPVV